MISPKKPWTIVGKSIDWGCQPFEWLAFKDLVRRDKATGYNFYCPFSSPGLTKPLWTGNSKGEPFEDRASLKWNRKYWDNIRDRYMYAWEVGGITCGNGEGFADSRMFHNSTVNWEALKDHVKRECEAFMDMSTIWIMGGEVEEGGSKAVAKALELCAIAKSICAPDPVGFHSVNCNEKWVGRGIDWISIQENGSLDMRRLKKLRDKHPNIPILIMENRKCNDSQIVSNLRGAHALGCTCIVGSKNFGTESEWLRGQIQEFSSEVS